MSESQPARIRRLSQTPGSSTPERARLLAEQALALPVSQRDQFIAANTSDPEEQAHVARLVNEADSVTRTGLYIPEGGVGRQPLPATNISRVSHYRIEQCIGEGGMGAVYRARDERLNRTVAIKLIHPGRALRPESRARFYNEAQTASGLNHPNIVTIHDIDQHDGIDYIVMELIEGKSLRAMLAEGPIPMADLVRYASQIADAVAAAHAANIVHRDLKPDNVMVTPRRLVKVLDFGLAKLNLGETTDPHLTSEGALIGTVSYMSPEQARGASADARCDVFSFGVMLHELVSGKHPFPGTNPTAILAAVLSAEPPPLPPDTPAPLADLIAGCLKKDPGQRIASMDEVKRRLDPLSLELQLSGSASAISRPMAPAVSHVRRRRRFAAAAAALAAGCGGILWLRLASHKQPAAPQETVLTRLTSDAGLTAFPDVSRDGKSVVYASDRASSGNLDIWMQRIGGGAVRLTTDDADDYDPSWSPDGTRIAYRSDRSGGGIHLMTVPDGASRLLVSGGRNPRFSPDGAAVAYWTGYEGGSNVPGAARIFMIPAIGGEPKSIAPDFGAASFPIWTPDGKELLFLGRTSGQPLEWYLAPLSGGAVRSTGALAAVRNRKLQSSMIWQHYFRPLGFAGAGAVVFAADSGDSTNIWELPFDVASGKATGPPRRRTSGVAVEHQASLPENSQSMVFASVALTIALWSAPLDPRTGEIRGEFQRLTQDISSEYFPTASADGSKLAFLSGKDGKFSISVRDLTTRRDTVLAITDYRFSQPQISPDGRKVAYWTAQSPPGQPRQYTIRVVDANGGAAEAVCTPRCGPATGFSSDSRYLLFEPISGRNSVFSLDLQTGQQHEQATANDRQLLFCGRFSPNQKLISFHGSLQPADRNGVFVAPAREGAREQDWIRLSDGASEDTEPSWSPKGDLLYYLSDRDGFRCVWARRLDPVTGKPSGGPLPIAHFHHARRSLRFLANRIGSAGPAAAGGRLHLAMADVTGNVWMSSPAPR